MSTPAVAPPSDAAADGGSSNNATTNLSSSISILPAPSIQLARALEATSVETIGSLSPYQLFQKQIESQSTEASLDAMKRLSVVAILMGHEAIQSELLPYLTALVTQQAPAASASTATALAATPPPPSDEWLLWLGQELKYVVQYYLTQPPSNNGDASKYKPEDFLPILERLAATEETVVREQAVVVFGYLAELQSNYGPAGAAASAPTWMALMKRLAHADWFTPKVSACGILPHCFAVVAGVPLHKNAAAAAAANNNGPPLVQLPPQHAGVLELLALYKELCHDETPMVRRAAAEHLGKCLASSGWNYRDDGLAVTVLSKLCHDEQDSVRRLAVVALKDAGSQFCQQSPAWTAQHWLPLLKEASTDLSWRVRHNLAKNFSEVAVTIGVNKDRRLANEQALVMACFVTVLTDVEAEVRAAAVAHLARMVSWGGQALFVTHLQPLLPALADDVVMEVRSKCALALMDSAHGGTLEDQIILQAFGPLLEAFLQDEFHEVQLQVLGNLYKIANLLPGLSGVVTTLLQMSKAANWRVRQAVAQLLPHLAEARGLEFFEKVLLEPAWMTLLLDPVASVRTAIVDGMPLLVQVAGDSWIMTHLMPQHVKTYQRFSDNSYLMRITILQGFILAATAAKAELLPEMVQWIVKALTTDKVANVRMVAARGCVQLLKLVNEEEGLPGDPDGTKVVQPQMKPALTQQLPKEDDADVRHACQVAIDLLQS